MHLQSSRVNSATNPNHTKMNTNPLPVVVTGASGFIGKHVVLSEYKKRPLFCIARRSRQESNIPADPNITWITVDISKQDRVREVTDYILEHGGAGYVLHLAGYYDFDNKEHPAYEATNVRGTENMLKMARSLKVRRFLFSSSLAACSFTPAGVSLTEDSEPDADIPYGRSKKKAEAIIRAYSGEVPSTVVRLAAVFSDWGEYPPLYSLLKMWTARGPMSRILPGRGESALPYIHVKDLVSLFGRIMAISDELDPFDVYLASPPGSVTHRALFHNATRYLYSRPVRPIRIPKWVAAFGMTVRYHLGRLLGRDVFEEPWMAAYIDKKLNVDPSATYARLGWEPKHRRQILRRLLFLTENMSNYPNNWKMRNEAMLQRVAVRGNLLIYDLLHDLRPVILDEIVQETLRPEKSRIFPHYQQKETKLLRWYIALNYQLLAVTIRNQDRSMIQTYAQQIASRRFAEGFGVEEIQAMLSLIGETVNKYLARQPNFFNYQHMDNFISLTIQFMADEIEDSYEILGSRSPVQLSRVDDPQGFSSSEALKRLVHRLEEIGGDPLESEFDHGTG